MFQRNKKGDIELDQIGKIVIALVLLIVLIVIISVVIRGEFTEQLGKLKDALFSF